MDIAFKIYKDTIYSLTHLDYIPESAFVEAWNNQECPEIAAIWIKEVYSSEDDEYKD